ncbi:MAG: hypothetical protein O7E52_27225 [Candidatus Poribacteria bacterium]|nr:hypothetical protein [Candidatus Poribacteria bacterium]
MFFKILSRRRYRQMLAEQKDLHQQYYQLEDNFRNLERQKKDLEERNKREIATLKRQLGALEQTTQDFELLQQRISEDIEGVTRELGLSRTQIEKLWADRSDLIELYIDKLYSLAKHFAQANREMRKNRGLFLLLIDRRNMADENFSEFYEGQTEHLMQPQYKGIDQIPQVFSLKVDDVFNYMGEKVILKDDSGEITGHEERDGALVIDLRGIAFRSRIMVEGVRTHRVYDKVERLQKGSAKHNAAIYASALEEVMAAIAISEETSEVTLFRDGRFIKSHDPYTGTEMLRKEKVVPMRREADAVTTLNGESQQDATMPEESDIEDETTLISPLQLQSG